LPPVSLEPVSLGVVEAVSLEPASLGVVEAVSLEPASLGVAMATQEAVGWIVASRRRCREPGGSEFVTVATDD
jgi:hypothetical protein